MSPLDTPELQYTYSSDLPYHPDHLCHGWDSPNRFISERRYNHSLMRGLSQSTDLARQYIKSYTDSDQPTLLHYRDKLLGRAILLSLKNLQFSSQSKYTPHTQRLWSLVPFEKIWDFIPINPEISYNFRYAAPLGTAAFYLKDLNLDGLYPLEVYLKLIRYIWGLIGITSDNSAATRHSWLLNKINIPISELQQISSSALHLLSEEGRFSNHSSFRPLLKQHLLGPNDFRNLPARFLLGEFNNKALEIPCQYLNLSPSKIIRAQHNIISILPPAGMPLLYTLLAIEGCINCAQYITSLPEQHYQLTLSEILRSNIPAHQSISEQIANHLCLTSDSLSILSLFNTTQFSPSLYQYFKAEVFNWLRASGKPNIPSDSPFRLSSFNTLLD